MSSDSEKRWLKANLKASQLTLNTQRDLLSTYERAKQATQESSVQFSDPGCCILHALWSIKPILDMSKPSYEDDKSLREQIKRLEEKFDWENKCFKGLTKEDWELIEKAVINRKPRVEKTINHYEEKIQQLKSQLE